MGDIYQNRQPVRTYPYLRAEGSVASPLSGENQTRALQKNLLYNIAASVTSPILFDTGVVDVNGNPGSVDLGRLAGSGAGTSDAFVVSFDIVSVFAQSNGLAIGAPAAITFASLLMYLVDTNPSPNGGILYSNAPLFGLSQNVPNVGWDFAPLMRNIRYDDYKYIDDRTNFLNNVRLQFQFFAQNSAASPGQIQVVINLRYQVNNILTVPAQNYASIPVNGNY